MLRSRQNIKRQGSDYVTLKKGEKRVEPTMIIGIVLILLGVVVLLLQFITLTTHVEGMHIGPFHTGADAKTTFPVSPF